MSLPLLWNEIEIFLNNNTIGVGVAIIGLDGVQRHWTVVTRITRNRMSFEDSGVLQTINRVAATVHIPNVSRRHKIVADEIIFLNNPNVELKKNDS